MLAFALAVTTKNVINRRKRAIARAELVAMRNGLSRYYLDNGYYPSTEQGVGAILPGGSVPSYELDPGMIRPGLVLRQLLDPWGHPFEYESNGNSYILRSLGPYAEEEDPELTVTGGP